MIHGVDVHIRKKCAYIYANKIKAQVYSLVSSAKSYSPDFITTINFPFSALPREWHVLSIIFSAQGTMQSPQKLHVRLDKMTNLPDELVVGIYQCKQDHREKSLVVVVEAACAGWTS